MTIKDLSYAVIGGLASLGGYLLYYLVAGTDATNFVNLNSFMVLSLIMGSLIGLSYQKVWWQTAAFLLFFLPIAVGFISVLNIQGEVQTNNILWSGLVMAMFNLVAIVVVPIWAGLTQGKTVQVVTK